ncbi:MAG: hypothetical protein LLG04_13905 [Parachlamydia sp.]|nr:hypothetical protein [Parachlamydia sp.]
MRRLQALLYIFALSFTLVVSAAEIKPLPRELEIELALSALPPHLRKDATVYTLNPAKGFELAREGNNGFHALVARTGDDAFFGPWTLKEYRDDLLIPISFDSAGAKAQMQVLFDIAEMQAKSTSPEEVRKILKDRFQKGYYKAPQRAGVSYMLSPILRTYQNPQKGDEVETVNFPHVMYYAPNITNKDIGSDAQNMMYPMVIGAGPHAYIIQGLGSNEKAAINQEYATMLEKLCKIKGVWCLSKDKGQ